MEWRMALTMYGIRNCDTVNKARAWLETAAIAYDFHDFKVRGVNPAQVQAWTDALGWERVLNRAGTIFRKLPEADTVGIDPARAVALMLAQPSMIRRPVLVGDGVLLLGFKPESWAAALA
jgi:arsenate reductase (glutaredoxin)